MEPINVSKTKEAQGTSCDCRRHTAWRLDSKQNIIWGDWYLRYLTLLCCECKNIYAVITRKIEAWLVMIGGGTEEREREGVWYRLLLLQNCYWNQCHYSFMIFNWLDLYHVLMIFSLPARTFKSFKLKKERFKNLRAFTIIIIAD